MCKVSQHCSVVARAMIATCLEDNDGAPFLKLTLISCGHSVSKIHAGQSHRFFHWDRRHGTPSTLSPSDCCSTRQVLRQPVVHLGGLLSCYSTSTHHRTLWCQCRQGVVEFTELRTFHVPWGRVLSGHENDCFGHPEAGSQTVTLTL